ncbi:MAG TPA: hypothetical protein VFQ39_03880 [Longimicrobium sp.]|nr:hypothetical protein [Longimicrobium sp.]
MEKKIVTHEMPREQPPPVRVEVDGLSRPEGASRPRDRPLDATNLIVPAGFLTGLAAIRRRLQTFALAPAVTAIAPRGLTGAARMG